MNAIRYLRDGYRWLRDPYRFLDRALLRHGLTFRARLPVLGDALMTGDHRLLEEIVHHKDLDGGKAVTGLRAIFGSRSLIMLEGEAHAARRRLIAPSFRGEGLAAYDELTARVTREVLRSLPYGRTFSMYGMLRRIGLKAMIAAMFGDGSAIAEHAEAVVERFLNSFGNPLILFFRPLRVDAGPWSPWGRALRNRRALCDLIRGQIQLRTKAPRGDTILGRLVADASGCTSLNEEDLIQEVLSLLLFGHDTAAATMAWAFAHIYQQRGLVQQLRDEVEAANADPPDPEALPLLKACIQESMRLCPVVVHLGRAATADLRLGDYTVRRGQRVIPCTYLAQHNPAIFSEPYMFRPQRFLHGERYEHAYFPFGFGSRTCVGKPFAMRQMLLVLATALRSVDLQLAPGYVPEPARHLVLIVPRGGTLMQRQQMPSAIPLRVGC
ncbi:MAG TPA: cytochrome P450 [Gemmataceae bacterium]|jgi:cytochrome P450|nr:cytochrome P450 [Gemmataceae bacterium]